jgi:hypothetical protein
MYSYRRFATVNGHFKLSHDKKSLRLPCLLALEKAKVGLFLYLCPRFNLQFKI